MKPLHLCLLAALLPVWLILVSAEPAEHYPEPEFAGNLVIDRTVIELGESFTLTTIFRNANDWAVARGDGRVYVSFPELTEADDRLLVADAGSSTGDVPGYLEHVPGDTTTYCSGLAAPYLVVEYADSDWESLEDNKVELSVTPREKGVFYFDVRGVMGDPGYPCNWGINKVPWNGIPGYTDATGHSVKRFEVLVEAPTPVRGTTWGRIKTLYD